MRRLFQHQEVAFVFRLVMSSLTASALAGPALSQISTEVSQSTPSVVPLSPSEAAALRNAELIVRRFREINASGKRSWSTDPEVKKAAEALRGYFVAAGTGAMNRIRAGQVDPMSVFVAATMAGEFDALKRDFHELRTAWKTKSLPRDFIEDKVATLLAERVIARTGGGPFTAVPTPVMQAAKLMGRSILAYEGGVLDAAAPQGFRPLLEKHPTTKRWLDEISTSRNTLASSTSPSLTPALRDRAATAPKKNQIALQSPHQQAPPPRSHPASPRVSPSTTFVPPKPGGISISKAAAERMPLNMSLEGAHFADSKLLLSGRPNDAHTLDAALFLTAIRLACLPGDPYFSLDADDGKKWVDEGQQLSDIVTEKVRGESMPNIRSKALRDGLTFRAILVRREYPSLWSSVATKYPNFQTRLVFRPDWLRLTRFGAILYEADVLLKELTAGVPVLPSTPHLRARAVEHYISSHARRSARQLLPVVERHESRTAAPQWRGHRLWFDLVAQTEGTNGASSSDRIEWQHGISNPQTSAGTALLASLKRQGYLSIATPESVKQAPAIEDGNAVDVSQLYPRMFVRRHDVATGKDLPGHDLDLDALSADVNQRTGQYASAYKELRALVDVFRAYVVAVKLTKSDGRICGAALSLPLLDSEKTPASLPEHHPSELFITMASFVHSGNRQKQRFSGGISSINGGIALRGKLFYDRQIEVSKPTAVTVDLNREIAAGVRDQPWKGSSGRHYVALQLGAEDWYEPRSRPSSPPVESDQPRAAGSTGRFDLYEDARISGTKLKSVPLRSDYTTSAKSAQNECAGVCSADDNCIAFEIDQSNNICHIYSTVSKTFRQPKWAHGIWR